MLPATTWLMSSGGCGRFRQSTPSSGTRSGIASRGPTTAPSEGELSGPDFAGNRRGDALCRSGGPSTGAERSSRSKLVAAFFQFVSRLLLELVLSVFTRSTSSLPRCRASSQLGLPFADAGLVVSRGAIHRRFDAHGADETLRHQPAVGVGFLALQARARDSGGDLPAQRDGFLVGLLRLLFDQARLLVSVWDRRAAKSASSRITSTTAGRCRRDASSSSGKGRTSGRSAAVGRGRAWRQFRIALRAWRFVGGVDAYVAEGRATSGLQTRARRRARGSPSRCRLPGAAPSRGSCRP